MIEREFIHKKTGKISREIVYGITSVPASHATPEQIIRDNRGPLEHSKPPLHHRLELRRRP
ncbi:MAG TPA: hypothetical protein PKJ85_12650 [Nitrosomonas nitrosa]|uniref:Uncharacterized protein n=1 Tax=Nitrosomonas nitrosa TaxID=52442 RepID=A0A8H8YZN9_9PROT|nr:hypothetical protein [Nitrosomonas nitrosa]MCO6433485.1 hypothetical protein [Nitrosomonas nitrosa]CAE6493440.1 hypothetical protein NMYAN_120133 [Nitrosomonas nitrosa]HNP52626.1 hypothetical protein [Nitrosomonas nitrosa]